MRSTTTFALMTLLLVVGSGCRSTSIQCQREMALLRAEILDLEDKYYALKSQHERGINSGEVIITDGVIGSGVVNSSPVITHYPADNGGVVYSESFVESLPGGGVQYESPTPTAAPIAAPSIQTAPTPAPALEPKLQLQPEALPLPGEAEGAFNQELELFPEQDINVAFDGTEILLPEVDRIEIVTKGTRGKNVDGVPGDEGIELMITTIDSSHDYVEATGELTITVRDPAIGEIGKWTFLPKELQLFLSQDELGNRGVLLHLPWNDQTPVSSNIVIRAKMLLNGIEYIATRSLSISPPQALASEDAVAAWTANDRRWLTNSRQPTLQASTKRRLPQARPPATTVERPKWRPVR